MLLAMTLSSCSKNPMEVETPHEAYKNAETSSSISDTVMGDFIVLHYDGTEVTYYRHATEKCWKWWPPGWYSVYYYTLRAKVSMRITPPPRNARVKVRSGYFTPFSVGYSYPPYGDSCDNCYLYFVKRSCDDPAHSGRIQIRITYYDARGAIIKDVWSNSFYKNYRYGYRNKGVHSNRQLK